MNGRALTAPRSRFLFIPFIPRIHSSPFSRASERMGRHAKECVAPTHTLAGPAGTGINRINRIKRMNDQKAGTP